MFVRAAFLDFGRNTLLQNGKGRHRIDQPYGSVATAALKYMVGRSVYLVATDTDRYGRTVAQLYHSKEGYDINASMVCAGYAWWYERYAPSDDFLESCEKEAKESPKGLWAEDDPVPPWEWRRR